MTRTNTEGARFAKASMGVTATTIAAILLGNASVAQAETFDGPYVGVAAGYEDYSDDLSGATYKAYAGWNIRLGENWVLAPEVSFGESTADGTEVRDTATFTETAVVGIDRQIGANLRFGRLVSDNVLVYAAGGWERFEVDATTTRRAKPCNNCTPTVQNFSFDEDLWTIGAGVEVALSEQFTLRGAYTYADGDAYHRHGLTAGLALQF